VAIVAAAIQAVKAKKGDEIPATHWGDAITKLKPVAVRNDKLNVAIILLKKDGIEEGLYVSNPISSYAPSASDGFEVFERLSTDQDKSFGQLYRYRLVQKAK
jgi:hypothetical protein